MRRHSGPPRQACLAGLLAITVLSGCNVLLGIEDRPLRPGADASNLEAAGDDAPTASAYYQAVMADEPLIYLRFGEVSGTVALDVQRVANGTYPSAGVTLGVPGALLHDQDRAIRLDGNGSILMPVSADFVGLTAFSVEVWINPDATLPAYGFVIDHEVDSNRAGWDLVAGTSGAPAGAVKIVFERYASPTNNASVPSGPTTVGTYHHVVGTFDVQQNERIYVDGSLVTTNANVSVPIAGAPSGWSIGAQNCSGCTGTAFVGNLDELAIYAGALSEDRVKAHFQAASQ